ncbi:MAG TPA: hypothetical protein VFN09_13605 [Rhodanobacteraceae bacterium]|nr:hypothetical protein [Rhodanobacteraceae bacterium]
MRRTLKTALLVTLLATLGACSHKSTDSNPLAYVPADTAFVLAGLEPLTPAQRDTLLKPSNMQLPFMVSQWRWLADQLAQAKNNAASNLLRGIATELDGKTWQQFAADNGIELFGHWAIYGVGLAPVYRGGLADAARFKALLDRLDKAAGQTPVQHSMGDFDYRTIALANSKLSVFVAVEGSQIVMTVAPDSIQPALLARILGATPPRASLADSERLQKLASSRGYLPNMVGVVDTKALLQAAFNADPYAQAMYDAIRKQAGKSPAPLPAATPACREDAARIAARLPEISAGFTTLEPRHVAQRVNIALAPDIIKAFGGVNATLPGLGLSTVDAPLAFALLTPFKQMQQFWSDQARAVAAKPFTCKPLLPLNAGIAALSSKLPLLSIPPMDTLLGIRVVIDRFGNLFNTSDRATGFSATLVAASTDPAAILKQLQGFQPNLASIQLAADGKPVALPSAVAAAAGGQAWMAMTDSAIGVAFGAGEDSRLAKAMAAPAGKSGALGRGHLNGRELAGVFRDMIDDTLAKASSSLPPAKVAELKQQMQGSWEAMARVERLDTRLRMGPNGLVADSDTDWHD